CTRDRPRIRCILENPKVMTWPSLQLFPCKCCASPPDVLNRYWTFIDPHAGGDLQRNSQYAQGAAVRNRSGSYTKLLRLDVLLYRSPMCNAATMSAAGGKPDW